MSEAAEQPSLPPFLLPSSRHAIPRTNYTQRPLALSALILPLFFGFLLSQSLLLRRNAIAEITSSSEPTNEACTSYVAVVVE